MPYFTERRRYVRCDNLVCKIFMSIDGVRWDEIKLCNISACGLKFETEETYEKGTVLKFNLLVYNMLSEFNINMNGKIVRSEECGDVNAYGVEFIDFNKYYQIQLDELIRSKITVSSNPIPAYNDQMYTFIDVSSLRRAKKKHLAKR